MPQPRELSRHLASAIGRFTTDPAVRTGILQAAWSIAPSYARSLLPRTPTQQAMVVGVNATTHYAIGATGWAATASLMAGIPGHHAGWRALLAGSAVTGGGGFVAERLLRPHSGDSLMIATVWSTAKLSATIGLAGGFVTLSDVVTHRWLKRPPSLGTTLLIDVAAGASMAAGSMIRRNRRARKYGVVEPDRPAVKRVHGVRAYATIGVISVGTAAGIAVLAVVEQTAARAVERGLTDLAGTDLGELGVWLSHSATGSVLAAAGLVALDRVRARTLRRNEVVEVAYRFPPKFKTVSCGPRSKVGFDAVGKEGRRFVLMALQSAQISNVMGEAAVDPVRAVIPPEGGEAERARLAVDELEALGGFERSVIVVASPTGVGYVNYVMAEALEYLTRGNCAILVPQYAMVPSALALGKTKSGTRLQEEVLEQVAARIRRIPAARRPRLHQFGESLGAQVAFDVAAVGGIARLDSLDVTAGLYLGVPFRSRAWHAWQDNPRSIDPRGRIVCVPEPAVAPKRPGMHLVVIHDDDPVNKFAYTMFVRRPWWFGRPEDRPPKVPRETLFRPVSSFVIGVIDVFNAMNQKPGQFRRLGHDYRIDVREAMQRAYSLPASPTQEAAIEKALREREQMWSERRLAENVASRMKTAIISKFNEWGSSTVSLELAEDENLDLSPVARAVLRQVSESKMLGRLGSGPSD
jgi:uncharacterized membrane protein